MNGLSSVLSNKWVALAARVGLGVIFLVAAWPKFHEPPTFAKNIHEYALVPDSLVNLQALLLPGVELVAGLLLVTGLWQRGAALVAGLMLFMFVSALAINVVRGNPVQCSCFELHAVLKSCAEQMREMELSILRDLGIFALVAHVLWWRKAET